MPFNCSPITTTMIVRLLTTAVAASALSFSLVGCSVPNTLQDTSTPATTGNAVEPSPQPDSTKQDALKRYVDNQRAQISTALKSSAGAYSDGSVELVAPDSVVFTYVYSRFVDPVEGAKYFDDHASELQNICDTRVFPAMEAAGVSGSKHAIYVYNNPDGSLIWTKDCAFSPTN